MRKALISLAVLIVVAPLAAVGLFLAINLSNTRLNPGAVRVLAQAEREHDVQGNAYYALIGFRLQGTASPEAKGRVYVTRLATMDLDARAAYSEKAFKKISDLRPNSECQPDERGCLTYYRHHEAQIAAAATPYQPLIEHYTSITRHYHAFYQPYNDLGWPEGLGKIHRAYLFQLSRRRDAKNSKAVLHSLDEDVAFWRMVLARANTMLTKVYAALMLREDYGFASDLLDACRQCRHMKMLRPMLSKLSDREMDLAPALRTNFVELVTLLRQEEKNPLHEGSSLATFYHENTMINAAWEMTQDQITITRTDDKSIDAVARRLDSKYTSDHGWWWLRLYVHPTAKVFASIAWVNPEPYVKDLRETQGLRETVYRKLIQ